jgi:hypothetical protein
VGALVSVEPYFGDAAGGLCCAQGEKASTKIGKKQRVDELRFTAPRFSDKNDFDARSVRLVGELIESRLSISVDVTVGTCEVSDARDLRGDTMTPGLKLR